MLNLMTESDSVNHYNRLLKREFLLCGKIITRYYNGMFLPPPPSLPQPKFQAFGDGTDFNYISVLVMAGKEIIISQTRNSLDVLNCGNLLIPCRTIDHAISLSQEGDVLRIDGGKNRYNPYSYRVKRQTTINSISIQKRYLKDINYPAPMIWAKFSKQINNVFRCAGSLSLSSISFGKAFHRQRKDRKNSWFLLTASSKFANISNCSFSSLPFFTEYLPDDKQIVMNITQSMFHKGYTAVYIIKCDKHNSRLILSDSVSIFNVIIFRKKIVVEHSNVTEARLKLHHDLNIKESIFNHSHIENYRHTISISYSIFEDCHIVNANHYNLLSKTFHISNSLFDSSPVILKGTCRGTITDCTFQNSVKMLPALGIVMVDNGGPSKIKSTCRVSIIRCIFRNNTSKRDYIPTIYAGSKNSRVYFIDSKVIAPRKETTIFNSETKINIKNSSFTCGRGYYMTFISRKTFPYWTMQTKCTSCIKGYYSLTKDSQKFKNLIWTYIRRNHSELCQKCPSNGVCEKGHIRSKGAYWGYVNSKTRKIVFLPCPSYYCCPSLQQCSSYNTCINNRTGRLCSRCYPGYSCSFNADYKCLANHECDNGAAGISIISIIAILFVVILLYLKEILLFIKRLVQRISSNDKTDNGEDDDDDSARVLMKDHLIPMPSHISNSPVSYQLISSNLSEHIDESYKQCSTLISGSVKILIFFYQTTSIIRIQSPEKLNIAFPKFFDVLSTFFNIRIDVDYSKSAICLLQNLSIMQVDVIKLGIMAIILVLLLLIWIAALLRQRIIHRNHSTSPKPQTTFHIINEDVPSFSTMPMLTRIKCAYLQFLLIAFSGITIFSFNAVYCVNIDGYWYFYKQASIQCYQPWQYFIIGLIIIWVMPFCLVIPICSKLLYRCRITPNQFIAALTWPPLIILLLLKVKRQKKESIHLEKMDAITAKHLLLVINEPFKESNGKDGPKICWESILILRRILLVFIKIFIVSPITKLFPMAVLLIVFTLHHVIVAPFSDARLNKMDFFSLNILSSFVVVNIFWAMTREYTLMENPMYHLLGKVLIFYETLILTLPFLFLAIFFIGYTLKQCIYYCISYFKIGFRWKTYH